MKASQEIFEKMKKEWETFESNQADFNEKGNKSAGSRARKSIGNIRNMVTEYRKVSLEESQ